MPVIPSVDCSPGCQTMDCMQQTKRGAGVTNNGHCPLKLVNFEVHDNHTAHRTEGLSKNHLVVRRGKPFKITLLFHSRSWNPHTERLVLEVLLGGMSEKIPVQFSDKLAKPLGWSATIYPGNMHPDSVTIHICSPVLSSVAMYNLHLHTQTRHIRTSYDVGSFVLLFNPWLKDDPVYMALDAEIQEYIQSDYGLVYMGTNLNIRKRPWSFGQYEPRVLEACLKLLHISPAHLSDKNKDYIRRADPVYVSRVVCAMVNCQDDWGILEGKWQGGYEGGVNPTEWSGSADILQRWVSSNFNPVRYGQCWVYASVLCTVMRVLGIPSRVVTVFNAAHDGNADLEIHEFYTTTGEKLNMSKDSIWNFHVWVECWMRRPDLGAEFDGWQVVDPTPQEKSGGIFCCGPCPVVAVKQRYLGSAYDTPFVYASVNADIIRIIVHNGREVERTVNTELVGQLICTKCIDSDSAVNLTDTYKTKKESWCGGPVRTGQSLSKSFSKRSATGFTSYCTALSTIHDASCSFTPKSARIDTGEEGTPSSLEVSLTIDGVPTVGESIDMRVTVKNKSSNPRVLVEHLNAQIKDYDSSPQESFWNIHKEVHIQPHEVLTLKHTIPPSEYESFLGGEDIMNLAVVIKDMETKERFLDAKEFNINSPQITIEIEGGDSIQMKKEHTVRVSFTNSLTKTLNRAVLTVEGSGLLRGKQEATLTLLKPGARIEKKLSITAASPGTKVLMATFSHSDSRNVISRTFHKISVTPA